MSQLTERLFEQKKVFILKRLSRQVFLRKTLKSALRLLRINYARRKFERNVREQIEQYYLRIQRQIFWSRYQEEHPEEMQENDDYVMDMLNISMDM